MKANYTSVLLRTIYGVIVGKQQADRRHPNATASQPRPKSALTRLGLIAVIMIRHRAALICLTVGYSVEYLSCYMMNSDLCGSPSRIRDEWDSDRWLINYWSIQALKEV